MLLQAHQSTASPVALIKPKFRGAGQLIWAGQQAVLPVGSVGADQPAAERPPLELSPGYSSARRGGGHIVEGNKLRIPESMDTHGIQDPRYLWGADTTQEGRWRTHVESQEPRTSTNKDIKVARVYLPEIVLKVGVDNQHVVDSDIQAEDMEITHCVDDEASSMSASPVSSKRRASPRPTEEPGFGLAWRPGGVGVGTGLSPREPVLFTDPYVELWRRQSPQAEAAENSFVQEERWMHATTRGRRSGTDQETVRLRAKGRQSLRLLQERIEARQQRRDGGRQRPSQRQRQVSNFTLFTRKKEKEAETQKSLEDGSTPDVKPRLEGFNFMDLAGGTRRQSTTARRQSVGTSPTAKRADAAKFAEKADA